MTKIFKGKLVGILFSIIIAAGLSSCGPKDADTQKAATEVLNNNSAFQSVAVTVNEGIATLTGEVMSDADKTAAEAAVKPVKGVKSVVNNIAVQAPPPPPVDVTADSTLTSQLKDALKDHPGVNGTVDAGVIMLTGEIKQSDLTTLMQKLTALKPRGINRDQLTIK